MLPFSLVCHLLEALHEQCAAGKHRQARETLQRWFQHHRQLVRALDSHDGAALLSTLLPARRTDRVYCIQAPRLEKIFARAQRLGASRVAELSRYKAPGSGVDLADCIFTILKATPNPMQHVTVSEVDALLNAVAFSSPAVRAADAALSASHRNGLESLYMRLSPLEAKWLTRLVLKDYRPIELDEVAVLRAYHPMLPCIMKVLDHFYPALAVLDRASAGAGHRYDKREILRHLTPVLGTKVGRPLWRKGRSIKHCLDMSRGRMSVEKKIDGEYCQVHVDLSKGRQCIQIFSKSGKDSTEDRSRLHRAICESLDIGQPSCKIKKGCILEGELVVYSDSEHKVLPFHKIRNHVTRSGRYMNTEMDSPPRSYEHLMIIYYDVLLIDEESLLGVRHSERFSRLKCLILTRPGYAELVDRHFIDIGRPQAASDLRNMFAKTILAREEGLVLKPDDPFISLDKPGAFCGSPIKFKKEYIGTFGDVGDFAVVGARYDPDKAKCYRIPGLKWTHFYLGCVGRKSDLYTPGAVPEFTAVTVVELNETMLRTVITHCQPLPVPFGDNWSFKLTIPPGLAQGKPPSVVFTQPLVFDLRCFSFDKEGNVGFYTPRFPAVTKVHFDRDYGDAVTFAELQEIAREATMERAWEDGASQELLEWVGRLERADAGGPVDRVTQETASTAMTPSPGVERRSSSIPGSAGSWGSSQASSWSRMTLTPPTSLPGPPSSPAEGQASTLPSAKRKSATGDRGPICGSQPMPLSGELRSWATGSQAGTSWPKRCKSDTENRKGVCCGPPGKHRDSPLLIQWSGAHRPQHHRREPLAEVAVNSLQCSPLTTSTVSQSDGNTDMPPLQQPMSRPPLPLITSPESPTTPSETTPPTSDVLNRGPGQASLCPRKGTNCAFHNRPLLLPPALAARKDIIALLLQHGIRSYTTDHAAWRPEDVHRPDTWKVCLVDAADRGGTLRFLEGVERRPLRSGRGREYVEVYDWQVLVWAREEEGGRKVGDGFARWFVGLV